MCAEKRQALHAAREPQGQQNKGQAQAQRIDDRQDATAPHVIGSSSGHGKHGRHRRANTRGPSQPEDHTQYWGTPQSGGGLVLDLDRKSTRLNSSHVAISYAVFCLKKKKATMEQTHYDNLKSLIDTKKALLPIRDKSTDIRD